MGLFDKLMGTNNIELTPQSALLLAAISMVAIDGSVDEDEVAVIRRLDGSGRTSDWDTALKVWKSDKSVEECAEMVAAALSPEQRLATLANLVDIAMADGVLAGAEKRLLELYVSLFEADESDIRSIVNVVSIKNNRSIFR